jgi:hypothetical protein
MTIQAWLPGEAPQQKTAQQGFITKVAPSTTVSLVGATLAATDILICTTIGAAGAVRVLGGADTTNASGNPNGPCLPGDTMVIANHTGQNLTIFPNNTAGTVRNLSAGSGQLIGAGLVASLFYFGSDNWAMSFA